MAFHDTEASYKALIYFKDGNSRVFYSWDFQHKKSKLRKPELGLHRLKGMIQKFRPKLETAIIYDLISGEEVVKYRGK